MSKIEFQTTLGAFTVEMYDRHAPMTCKNFVELARKGFYNGVIFHRIVPNFVIQGGDPTGTGRGGDSIYGGPFKDEISPALKHTGWALNRSLGGLAMVDFDAVAGVLSMANSGPNTNRSQFFVTLAPTPHLDGKHTIFGRVSGGMETILAISRVPTGANDRPTAEIKIIKATVL